jgi:hypothetical protein
MPMILLLCVAILILAAISAPPLWGYHVEPPVESPPGRSQDGKPAQIETPFAFFPNRESEHYADFQIITRTKLMLHIDQIIYHVRGMVNRSCMQYVGRLYSIPNNISHVINRNCDITIIMLSIATHITATQIKFGYDPA